ncbi:unnamed protein product [Closterium sp. Naga37s-1]|nr:unnamed protein product [Closterium sp. Naga37s-1]
MHTRWRLFALDLSTLLAQPAFLLSTSPCCSPLSASPLWPLFPPPSSPPFPLPLTSCPFSSTPTSRFVFSPLPPELIPPPPRSGSNASVGCNAASHGSRLKEVGRVGSAGLKKGVMRRCVLAGLKEVGTGGASGRTKCVAVAPNVEEMPGAGERRAGERGAGERQGGEETRVGERQWGGERRVGERLGGGGAQREGQV